MCLVFGCFSITSFAAADDEISVLGYTEKIKTKTFTHSNLFSVNGTSYSITATVSGVYSSADDYALIKTITATSSPSNSNIWFMVSYNDDQALLQIFHGSTLKKRIKYVMQTNGYIYNENPY